MILFTSSDGKIWTKKDLPGFSYYKNIVWCPELSIFVGVGGPNLWGGRVLVGN